MLKGASWRSGVHARLRLAGGYDDMSVSIHHHPSRTSLTVEPPPAGRSTACTQRLPRPPSACHVKIIAPRNRQAQGKEKPLPNIRAEAIQIK